MDNVQTPAIGAAVQKVSGATAGGSGVLTMVMDFFNHNAAGIGAMCTVATFVVYAGVSLYRILKERDDNSD